jgi:predicted RNA polymerase sigma factor
MTPKDFVVRLRAAVIEENIAIYRDLFESTPAEKASDVYWKKALALFNALSPEQQEVFFEVVRQIAVDTTSNVLGVIDGINAVEGLDAELVLSYGGGNQPLNGDLQSLFLVEEENAAQ